MRMRTLWVAIFGYVLGHALPMAARVVCRRSSGATTRTFAGDGWTFKAAPGWVVREGARLGDYEVVRQQP